VISFGTLPNVTLILYTFELLRNTFQRGNIHRAQRLSLRIGKTATAGINNRVNETFGIITELKITSQATNFIKQILSFSAHGGSYTEVTSFTCGRWLELKLRYLPVRECFL
jgi:hypothetical protein